MTGERRNRDYDPNPTGEQPPSTFFDDEITPPRGTEISVAGDSDSTSTATDAAEALEQKFARSQPQNRLRAKIDTQDLAVRNEFTRVKDAIASSLDRQGMLVFQAPTGSGKSLYGPLAAREIIRAEGRPDHIVVLQPRRDAAGGVATAMAAVAGEHGEELGRDIGFSTSETRQVRLDSSVKVITPGIFLRWLKDGQLTKAHVGALVIDEAHESSVEYHLILGLIKRLQEQGTAPPVIFMSATPDTTTLQKFYGLDKKDYVEVAGRPHPVETFYSEKPEVDYLAATAERVHSICTKKGPGDVLVFLPGTSEINTVAKQLGRIPNTEILPLHGQLPPEARQAIIDGNKNPNIRRVILSTNIAETSVTVPGLGFIVDSGRERDVRFDAEAGITRKGTGFISQAQARQREGRVGRTDIGECYRILTTEEFAALSERPEAAIHRENLAHLILQLKNMGIEPVDFPFIDPPEPGALQKGLEELQMLGALDDAGHITEIGREIGALKYFEPRIGRLIVESRRERCEEAALVLAAFERESKVLVPLNRPDHEERNQMWNRDNSDWLMRLKIFIAAYDNDLYAAVKKDDRRAESHFYNWCRNNKFNPNALIHLASRLDDYAVCAGIDCSRDYFVDQLRDADVRALSRVILAAHPDQVLLRCNATGYAKVDSVRAIADGKGSDVRPIYLDSNSIGAKALPDLCIGKVTEEPSGGLYANAVHPVTFDALQHVTPQLLETVRDPAHYVRSYGAVQRTVRYFPRGVPGTKFAADYQLAERLEYVNDGPEAVRAFAEALANSQVDENRRDYFDIQRSGPLSLLNLENQKTLAFLQNLQLRSRGRLILPSLTDWYISKLGKACSESTALAIKDRLIIKVTELCPPALEEAIVREYPAEVEIAKQTYPVHYEPSPDGPTAPPIARIEMSDFRLPYLRPADIPVLGPPDAPQHLIISIYNDIEGGEVQSSDLIFLQEQFEPARIRKEFAHSDLADLKMPLRVDDEQPLPTPAELGYNPVEFTTDFRGQPVYAYPGILHNYQSSTFFIYYFLTELEAATCTQEAEAARPSIAVQRKSDEAAKRALAETRRLQEIARAETERLRTAYDLWLLNHRPIQLDQIDEMAPLPPPAEIGYEPIVYAKNSSGEPQFAYPCIVQKYTQASYYSTPAVGNYTLEYRPTQTAATREQDASTVRHQFRLENKKKAEHAQATIDKVLGVINNLAPGTPDSPFTRADITHYHFLIASATQLGAPPGDPAIRAAESVLEKIKKIQQEYKTTYQPLWAEVTKLHQALVQSGKVALLNGDQRNIARLGNCTPREYDSLCRAWADALKYIKGGGLGNQNYFGEALWQAKEAKSYLSGLMSALRVSLESLPVETQHDLLDQLNFWEAFMQSQARTDLTADILTEIAEAKKAAHQNHNAKSIGSLFRKIENRVKPFLQKFEHKKGTAASWAAAYKKIWREILPKVEAEYGGVLTPEASRLIQPNLFTFAKELAAAPDDAALHKIEEKIEMEIAGAF